MDLFRKRGWISLLDAEVAEGLMGAAEERRYVARESVCEAGDSSGGIYGVLSGGIGCWCGSIYAEEALSHIARAGVWFGEGPLVLGQPRTVTFRALEDSVLLHLPQSYLRRRMADDAGFNRSLSLLAEDSAQGMVRMIADLQITDASRRLAAVMLRVTGAENGIAPPDLRGWPLSQAELGEMSGLSRHHVNRLLQMLQRLGLVQLGYGRIRIADASALTEHAAGGGAWQAAA